MVAAPVPANEAERLAALRSYDILDTACETAFDDIADIARQLLRAPIGLVTLIDAERQWFKANLGLDFRQTPRDQAFCAHAILGSAPLVVPDATQDVRFADNPLVTGPNNIRFYAGVPLVNPQGFVLGTLCVIDTVSRDIGSVDTKMLRGLARTAGTAMELHRALHDMRRVAATDPLTGLANRRAFYQRLETAISRQRRTGKPLDVLYLDLDQFKLINDRHGHAVGDDALQQIAAALRSASRLEDFAARLGGDEFALILDDQADESPNPAAEWRLSATAERIRKSINDAMGRRKWPVTASIGAVRFLAPPETAADALAVADRLMYEAKGAGRNCIRHLLC